MNNAEDARATSPCIDICTIDHGLGLCLGCLRTIDEILAWQTMGATARRQVLARLPARRRTGLAAPADPLI